MAFNLGQRKYPDRSSRVIPNVLPNIVKVDGDIKRAMYTTFMDRLPSDATKQEKITWDVLGRFPRTDTIDGAVSSTTQTTLKVDNPDRFIPNQLWVVKRTGEVLGVQEVDVPTQIVTVIRALTAQNSSGGTAAAAIVDGDTLVRISSYMGENNSRQITQTLDPTEVYNYCQIFRSDLDLSDRQAKREMVNENDLPLYQQEAMKEFLIDMDNAHLFGERSRFYDADGDIVTTMAGIRSIISTNVFDVGGTLFESQFDEFLAEEGMRKGSTKKVLFASTRLFLAITNIAKTRMRYDVDISAKKGVSLGVTVATYMDPSGGELAIVEDRNISETRNGEGYGVDMAQLKKRPFSNNGRTGDIAFHADTSDNDTFNDTSTLYADIGMTYGAEECHFIMKNVDGGSSDMPNS